MGNVGEHLPHREGRQLWLEHCGGARASLSGWKARPLADHSAGPLSVARRSVLRDWRMRLPRYSTTRADRPIYFRRLGNAPALGGAADGKGFGEASTVVANQF